MKYVERTCETCGKTFDAKPYKVRAGKARHCSRACYRDSVKRTPKTCAHCGSAIPETGWHAEAKFCSQACYHAHGRGAHWKGGRVIEKNGYVLVWAPDSPMARSTGYATEHRLVMAQHLGRALRPGEVVHHVNGVRDDNRIENLELYADHREHMRRHASASTSSG